nr:unnamed protein product [Callosobruchus chinensis]
MYLSKISKQSISVIIPEVCKALIDSLSGDVQVCLTFFITSFVSISLKINAKFIG